MNLILSGTVEEYLQRVTEYQSLDENIRKSEQRGDSAPLCYFTVHTGQVYGAVNQ